MTGLKTPPTEMMPVQWYNSMSSTEMMGTPALSQHQTREPSDSSWGLVLGDGQGLDLLESKYCTSQLWWSSRAVESWFLHTGLSPLLLVSSSFFFHPLSTLAWLACGDDGNPSEPGDLRLMDSWLHFGPAE